MLLPSDEARVSLIGVPLETFEGHEGLFFTVVSAEPSFQWITTVCVSLLPGSVNEPVNVATACSSAGSAVREAMAGATL